MSQQKLRNRSKISQKSSRVHFTAGCFATICLTVYLFRGVGREVNDKDQDEISAGLSRSKMIGSGEDNNVSKKFKRNTTITDELRGISKKEILQENKTHIIYRSETQLKSQEHFPKTNLRRIEKKSSNLQNSSNIMDLIHSLFDLGTSNPTELLQRFNRDPLGVSNGPHSFICPLDDSNKLTYPDLINHNISVAFRAHMDGTYILFQHLRKAGGTAFCDLAQSNLERKAVPSYFCMPDNRGSLATPPWNDGAYLSNHMKKYGFRIAANEWDVFLSEMHQWPGAVLATTFRHPIDRWYSQYR